MSSRLMCSTTSSAPAALSPWKWSTIVALAVHHNPTRQFAPAIKREPLSASSLNFSFLSERGERRMQPAERSSLHIFITSCCLFFVRCDAWQLAYAHAVQLLVDVFLLLTPFALYSEVGFWSIAATGVLTTFYQASGECCIGAIATLSFHFVYFIL